MRIQLGILLGLALISLTKARSLPPGVPPEPWYGDFLGSLTDPQGIGITGDVYAVNKTCLQILNFTYGAQAPDLYFWADREPQLTSTGVRISSFEYGDAVLKEYQNARVVLNLPDGHSIAHFKSFGLWCHAFSKNFGSVSLADGQNPPKAQFLEGTIVGVRYNVGSGPVLVLDRRRVKVFGFTFDGKKAPDGYFFVGTGPEPRHDQGVKVPIRGRDTPDYVTAINQDFSGSEDLILELPADYDVYRIDWISVYCYEYEVDFGHIPVRNLSPRIPPYVPLQEKRAQLEELRMPPWPVVTLLGRESRRNFTFQLGPPGGERGYQAMARAVPAENVWYVNGYMAPEIWLKRGLTYTFIVEGGAELDSKLYNNPLYISDEPFGGFEKLIPEDREKINIYAGVEGARMAPLEGAAGRLCLWSPSNEGGVAAEADAAENFLDFKTGLTLRCSRGRPGQFTFTPTKDTPDNLYYQSYTTYRMGWKLRVVDEIPAELPDFPDDFSYKYELWIDQNLITEYPAGRKSPSAAGRAAGANAAAPPLAPPPPSSSTGILGFLFLLLASLLWRY